MNARRTKNSMNRRSLLKGAVALGLAACAGEGMAEEQQDKVKAAPALPSQSPLVTLTKSRPSGFRHAGSMWW